MRIPIYFPTIKYHFLLFFTYPLELVAYILRYFVRVIFLLAFWSIVFEGIENPQLDYRNLLSYFLLSTAISDIVMSDNTNLGRAIRKSVKDGGINSILIKPVNVIGYYYSSTLGSLGVKNILSILSILLALIISPPSSIISVLLFFAFLINAFLIAFTYNIFEGALSLIFTEVGGIKNALHHITRLLSGQTIPFTFFPKYLQEILLLTPIPAMVYGPISVLGETSITEEVIQSYLVGFIWGVVLLFIINKFWIFSLKRFDSAGN